MSSIKTDADVICPNKCRTFNTKVYTFIRADKDANLKRTIISGELNLIECPDCGTLFYYNEPLVYLDGVRQLLVFVFPSEYEKYASKWQKKMDTDFKILKKGLAKEMKINFKPLTVFGTQNLQKLLKDDEDRTEETEVIICLAVSLGIETKPIKPFIARKNDFPFAFPYKKKPITKESILIACGEILKGHSKLEKLKNFADKIKNAEKLTDFL